MTKKEMVKTLKEQDRMLAEIFKAREEIADMARSQGIYDEVWEALFRDKESHYSF